MSVYLNIRCKIVWSCFQAIHGYRETEQKQWNEKNTEILRRVRGTAFEPGALHISYVHVLDLAKEGSIKPHIDSVRVSWRQ